MARCSCLMLREIGSVKQYEGELFRRWFEDDFFDLFVWYDQSHRLFGFQLCYDKTHRENALTWLEDRGYSHHSIDAGETSVWEMKAPTLLNDASFADRRVIESFIARSKNIDAEISTLVLEKLKEYAAR